MISRESRELEARRSFVGEYDREQERNYLVGDINQKAEAAIEEILDAADTSNDEDEYWELLQEGWRPSQALEILKKRKENPNA